MITSKIIETYELICDCCWKEFWMKPGMTSHVETPAELLKEAKEQGWAKHEDGDWLCPDCQ